MCRVRAYCRVRVWCSIRSTVVGLGSTKGLESVVVGLGSATGLGSDIVGLGYARIHHSSGNWEAGQRSPLLRVQWGKCQIFREGLFRVEVLRLSGGHLHLCQPQSTWYLSYSSGIHHD